MKLTTILLFNYVMMIVDRPFCTHYLVLQKSKNKLKTKKSEK